MPIKSSRTYEIKKVTTPLTFKNSKAYDSEGNLLKCVETLSDVRFMVEPREGVLSDDEVMQYAPQTKAASKIRLKRGFGDGSDVLLVHESVPWVLGLYYVILICITIPVAFLNMLIGLFVLLILFILPLIYLYHIFNIDNYGKSDVKKVKGTATKKTATKKTEVETKATAVEDNVLESLKKYKKEVNNLKVLFDVKEGVVRDLIKKRFEPPQITYDKFISMIDNCHKIFYNQVETATNIINLAADDSPRVESEIQSKIDIMKSIINQIEDLTNELVINLNSDEESNEDMKNLADEMENLIDSVKDY